MEDFSKGRLPLAHVDGVRQPTPDRPVPASVRYFPRHVAFYFAVCRCQWDAAAATAAGASRRSSPRRRHSSQVTPSCSTQSVVTKAKRKSRRATNRLTDSRRPTGDNGAALAPNARTAETRPHRHWPCRFCARRRPESWVDLACGVGRLLLLLRGCSARSFRQPARSPPEVIACVCRPRSLVVVLGLPTSLLHPSTSRVNCLL